MPTLFFSYDTAYHEGRILEKTRIPPREKKAALEALEDLDIKRHTYAQRELRAVLSAKDLALKQIKKYQATEKEWRKRQRKAIQLRAQYDEEFIKKSKQGLEARNEVLNRRLVRRHELLGMYGNKAHMSYTNSGYF